MLSHTVHSFCFKVHILDNCIYILTYSLYYSVIVDNVPGSLVLDLRSIYCVFVFGQGLSVLRPSQLGLQEEM